MLNVLKLGGDRIALDAETAETSIAAAQSFGEYDKKTEEVLFPSHRIEFKIPGNHIFRESPHVC